MKTLMKKIMRRSYLVGMASMFCPALIQIEPLDMPAESDSDNIKNDWAQVGSYITKSYESCKAGK